MTEFTCEEFCITIFIEDWGEFYILSPVNVSSKMNASTSGVYNWGKGLIC